MYFHQLESVEFVHASHGQTFLPTLYIRARTRWKLAWRAGNVRVMPFPAG